MILIHLIFKQSVKVTNRVISRSVLNCCLLYIIGFIISIFLSFIEWHLEITSFFDGCILGVIIWSGCIVPTQLYAYIYKKITFSHFIIILLQWFLVFSVIGGILAE